jgi:hypothetical protein
LHRVPVTSCAGRTAASSLLTDPDSAYLAAPMTSVLMVWVVVCAFGFARYRPPTLLAGLQAAGASTPGTECAKRCQ